MTKTPTIHPPISDIISVYFQHFEREAPAAARPRAAVVRAHLEGHLESEGPNVLTTGQLAILETEREFSPGGAFARTMHADDLYYALVQYLGPEFALGDRLLRRTQLDVIDGLGHMVRSSGLVSARNVSECVLIDFDIALQRARAELRAPATTRGS